MDPLNVKRRLTCIFAADAVGYSQQMGHDEEGTIRVLAAHRAIIDGIITFHGGRIISTAGDSVLAEFSSVVEAVRCAVEVQEALKTRNDSLPESRRMQFRVGINLGDVVVKDNDLLGDGVNVAARLETLAEPGGICISSSVYDQITGKLDLGFKDIGEQALKNISRPIRVYRVSGTGVPQPPISIPAPKAPARKPFPWGIAAATVVALAGIASWQTGLVRFGASDRPKATAEAPVAPPPIAPGPSVATPPLIDADTQRARADAEALKKRAEAELSRVRSDAEAARAARSKADAEAMADRIRARAEADAARIRADVEASLARAKIGNEAIPKDAETRTAKAAPAPPPVAASATAGPHFDGAWAVTVACAPTSDKAAGYKFDFVAEIKDNFLRGERRTPGSPGWMKLQGAIQVDGSATLDANGLTDDPKYAINNVASGSPYFYHVVAHFEGNHGSGHRVELRACALQFAKQ